MDYIKAKTGVISNNFIKHCNDIGHVIYWHKQYGQSIQVRQHKQLRWLLIDQILQSVIEKDNPEHLLFPHLKTLSEIWQPLEKATNCIRAWIRRWRYKKLLTVALP